jgi:hypothetical protein
MSHEKEEANHLGCKVYLLEAQIPPIFVDPLLLFFPLGCVYLCSRLPCTGLFFYYNSFDTASMFCFDFFDFFFSPSVFVN